MTMTRSSRVTALALALMWGAAAPAVAQSATEDRHHREMGPSAGSEQARPSMPGPGPAMMMDPQAMHEMMHQMMIQGGMGPGMMPQMPATMGQGPQGQMGPGMMGPGMGQGMGPGMMPQMPGIMMQQMPGMMGQWPSQGAPGGWRITPVMHLGIDDVQHYLEHFIEVHELQHLTVGEVRQTDDDTITADLVTQEGSLALQLEVDRHTGLVRKVS